MLTRLTLILLSVFITFSEVHAQNEQDEKDKAYIWFDLGDVIVETRDGFNKLKYLPNALVYINELKSEGHSVGVIFNIPESFGFDGDYQSKLLATADFITQGWIDTSLFSFTIFDDVLLPLKDLQRKPNPYLFQIALDISQNRSLKPIFIGEDPKETAIAASLGFKTHTVTYNDKTPIFSDLNELLSKNQSKNNDRTAGD